MTSKLLESIGLAGDSARAIKDDLGFALKSVFLVQRKWTGREGVGDGFMKEAIVQVFPSPSIQEFKHDIRLTAGGSVEAGDIVLKGVSKTKYPEEDILNGSSEDKQIENLYKVGDNYYTVISVKEKLISWQIHLRKITNGRD